MPAKRDSACRRAQRLAGWMLVLLVPGAIHGQSAYRYRDSSGQWVFTDQAPAGAQELDSISIARDQRILNVAVKLERDAGAARLVAVNDCLCAVTVEAVISQSSIAAIAAGARFHALLPPGSRRTLVETSRDAELEFQWKTALGSPDAVHEPARPYRVPYAVGSTYDISQAYPSRLTHTAPDSEYAVDIALPDGTPVYAAREGIVIDARHDYHRTALAPVMMDQANVIAILHDDGTIALYAHLHWDSIRVRVGAHVARGEYIANSGNTGFSSGPHLHFAVIRNAGTENVSIPVQFAGIAGVAVTPVDHAPLTAY